MGLAYKAVKVLQRSEERVDVTVIGNVIPEIRHGGRIDGRDPQSVDAKPHEIVQAFQDAAEIPDAIAIPVLERPRIDLIDDSLLPPNCLRHQATCLSTII